MLDPCFPAISFGGNLPFCPSFLFLSPSEPAVQNPSSLVVSFHPSHHCTQQEIILHTLFESGSSKVQDLERYISDDVERYGARLSELEKKLVGAYRELTANETLEDEGLFDEEDEEETGALAMGDFADMLGEDYLGLRELGIAAEFGMSSLSIPKRLLKGKKGKGVVAAYVLSCFLAFVFFVFPLQSLPLLNFG